MFFTTFVGIKFKIEMASDDTLISQYSQSKITMMWLGMIGMGMLFAGLTSAIVISRNRPDWLYSFEMPYAFHLSAIVILVSSFSFARVKNMIGREKHKTATAYLLITLLLTITFVLLQLFGFDTIIERGYYFTGPASNVTTSFLYVLVVAHLVHLFVGVIVLLTVGTKHLLHHYTPVNLLGLRIALLYWHFLTFIWIYLFVLFVFIS